MWMWKWIMKILGRPSEEELAQRVHDIAYAEWMQTPSESIRGEEGWVCLFTGDPGYEEAEKLLAGHSARGFQVQNMFLEWSTQHNTRKSYRLGWVSDGREGIWVTLFKLHPRR